MTKIGRVLGAVSVMTIVACAQRTVAIAPDSMDELHAAVLEDASVATGEALDDASRALPPMDAPAEREGVVAGVRPEENAPAMEEEGPPKTPEPSSTGESKAKSPKAPPELWNPPTKPMP